MALTTHPPVWIMSLNRLFFFFEVTPYILILSLLLLDSYLIKKTDPVDISVSNYNPKLDT